MTDEDGNPIVNLGDILLNLSAIKVQAENYGHTFEREAGFLAAHSWLHLLGYDHIEKRDERLMIQKQKRLMIAAGLKSKTLFTISVSCSSLILPVPNVSTITDTGFATPMA